MAYKRTLKRIDSAFLPEEILNESGVNDSSLTLTHSLILHEKNQNTVFFLVRISGNLDLLRRLGELSKSPY